MPSSSDHIPAETIQHRILIVRGRRVLLDPDLARFCGVTTLPQLKNSRSFYLIYHGLLDGTKGHAAHAFSVEGKKATQCVAFLPADEKGYAPRTLSAPTISDAPCRKSNAPRSESGEWKPGQLNPNLSWTHYRTLMRVDRPDARAFYEIEAVKESWSGGWNRSVTNES